MTYPTLVERCESRHPTWTDLRCTRVFPEGETGHAKQHWHDRERWGSPFRGKPDKRIVYLYPNPGGPLPEKPGAAFLALNAIPNSGRVLDIILTQLGEQSEAMGQTSQEWGWFEGFGDAAQTISDLRETLT